MIPANSFLQTVQVNVDNDKLSDAEFRQFVRNTLPIVTFPRAKMTCSACSGSGYYDDTGSPPCGNCNGTGQVDRK